MAQRNRQGINMFEMQKMIAGQINKFFQWHEKLTYRVLDSYNISDYTALWIAFAKGIITVLLIQWII